jgi:uncharacterized protein (DUF433 family)
MELQRTETEVIPPTAGYGQVLVEPGYCGGKPHIAGHRIKVQQVAVWHERLGKAPTRSRPRTPA